VIAALAGRRVDAEGAAEPRFPAAMIPVVRDRIYDLFRESNVKTLVCSAANGSDLLALDVAGPFGIRRIVILPADRQRFFESSVADRPGEWGAIYDRVLDEIEANGDLLVLGTDLDDDAYANATARIIEEAANISKSDGEPALAIVVWNMRSRGPGDLTELFKVDTKKRGFRVVEIDTLGSAE